MCVVAALCRPARSVDCVEFIWNSNFISELNHIISLQQHRTSLAGVAVLMCAVSAVSVLPAPMAQNRQHFGAAYNGAALLWTRPERQTTFGCEALASLAVGVALMKTLLLVLDSFGLMTFFRFGLKLLPRHGGVMSLQEPS